MAGAAALAPAPQGRQLTPRVAPQPSAVLLTAGAYRVSRNPVYARVLCVEAGWAVLRRRAEPVTAWVALAVVLHVKTAMEERALRARFVQEYDAYAAVTPRPLGVRR